MESWKLSVFKLSRCLEMVEPVKPVKPCKPLQSADEYPSYTEGLGMDINDISCKSKEDES